MEEETTSGVVTRLRRRLSTDTEGSISPATPTKKKSGRLAVKPQLENIDELATIGTKRSRKSFTKEATEMVDDKHLTPSRRSSRIRSATPNAYQCCESPRARRAARRNSHTGIENELSVTPSRRRTRKTSNSSLESQELGDHKLNESNNELKDLKEINNSLPIIRRSPRLKAKKNVQNTDLENISIEDAKLSINTENKENGDHLNAENELCHNTTTTETQFTIPNLGFDKSIEKKNVHVLENAFLSDDVLVDNMDKKLNTIHILRENKSLSFKNHNKTKNRNRSKSFTNFSEKALGTENIFFSDNEKRRKDVLKNRAEIFNCSDFERNPKDSQKKNRTLGSNWIVNIENHGKSKENPVDFSENPKMRTHLTEDFESDSLHKISKNINKKSVTETDDQCVPEVDQQFNNENKQISDFNLSNKEKIILCSTEQEKANNDCEPMEVDETISDVKFISNQTKETQGSNLSEQSKSMTKLNHSDSCKKNDSNLTLLTTVTVDLIDIHANKHGASSLNSNFVNKSESLLLPVTVSNKNDKQNQSDIVDTSSKQKQIEKLGMTTSTPVSISNHSKMYKQGKENSNLPSKPTTVSEITDISDEAPDRNEFLNDEADDAGLDYESGDSRDEEERLYEEENEILEKGVTLTSDSKMSDDSDYEKDSFLVSSDEQDYELLSGSGDDLTLSDNELTMAVKSKIKYNDRKTKETKLASREMFAARHNIRSDSSIKNINKKTNRIPTLKYSDSSEESESVSTNKNQESKSTLENSNYVNNGNKKDSGMSTNDSNTVVDEKELTIEFNKNETLTKDPLSRSLVLKEEIRSFSKDMSMSSVSSTNLENIAQVDVVQDTSMMETDIIKDPLEESDNDSGSSLSENETLVQSYENMLNNLNMMHSTQKIKTKNISLNLDTKRNSKKEKSVIDNLNITIPKSPSQTLMRNLKKMVDGTKVEDEADNNMSSNKKETLETSVTADSPKSTLHNDSIQKGKKEKKNSVSHVTSDSTVTMAPEINSDLLFIEDLEGSKNNLYETESHDDNYVYTTEKIVKKKNKKHSGDDVENIVADVSTRKLTAENRPSNMTEKQNASNISVIETESSEENHIDTTEKSAKKKKKKHSVDKTMVNETNVIASNVTAKENISGSIKDTESFEENYVDRTEKRAQKKKENHSTDENIVDEVNAENVSFPNVAKKNLSDSVKDKESSEENYIGRTENIAKKKKKKHSTDENIVDEVNAENVSSPNVAKENLSDSVKDKESSEENYIGRTENIAKKKKKKHSTDENIVDEVNAENVSSPNVAKENLSDSVKDKESSEENYIGRTENIAKKKKKKHYERNIEYTAGEVNSVHVLATNIDSIGTTIENTSSSVKKTESSDETHLDTTEKTGKKKKKKLSADKNIVGEVNTINILASNVTRKENACESVKEPEASEENHIVTTEKRTKIKKKKQSEEKLENSMADVNALNVLTLNKSSNEKTKKKSSNSANETESLEENMPSTSAVVKSTKRKKKHSSGDSGNVVTDENLISTSSLDSKLLHGSTYSHSKQLSHKEQNKKKKSEGDNTDDLPTSKSCHSISNEDLVPEEGDLLMSNKCKRKYSNYLKDAMESNDVIHFRAEQELSSKNKKRKRSDNSTPTGCSEVGEWKITEKRDDDPKEKHLKSQTSSMHIEKANEDWYKSTNSLQIFNKKSKKKQTMDDYQQDADHLEEVEEVRNDYLKKRKQDTQFTEHAENSENGTKRVKKRKTRDEDDFNNVKSVKYQKIKSTKVGHTVTHNVIETSNLNSKGSKIIFGHPSVPRLPETVIQQLNEKPLSKKPKIMGHPMAISTTTFHVEKTKTNKVKPSEYLEQSVHIESSSLEPKKKKQKLMNIAPVPSSSACGFTTTFKVNVMPAEMHFVAQSLNTNFKRDHLYKKNIRRQNTYELYRKQRKIKLSKF